MTVIYRQGHDNPADYLSRHPIHLPPSDREQKVVEEYINYILSTSTPKAMTIEEVATETAKDKTLTAVIQALLTNNWTPDSTAQDTTKQSRPNRTYRTSRHREIHENIRNCHTCQISTHKPAREPLQMSPLPAAPWTEVSADFGHLQNGKYLLVVTDEYSRYVVVDILDSISTTSVIPRLDKIFAEFGVPVSLKTDNGPPFNSSDFKDYASLAGFKHRKITPLWPQANAETERFMQTVKKSIKAALIKGRSWKQELFKFLLNYRTTPHCTTGVPPASVLFGRTIKNRLPHLITSIAGDSSIRERDTQAKTTMKRYADRKTYVKPNDLRVGDTVIIKNDHTSKALTPYQPNDCDKEKGIHNCHTRGQPNYKKCQLFQENPKTTNKPHTQPTPLLFI
ncbi:unnamed protein product [Acanthosepion pharaonis]|uniref:Integrase catalytic domain-containing protein n=1 Tax=Acanthosepion pharaonis TaxID=158019 RepID=A0A812CWN4_ACAPH|nr:unnamed protein product [Sepia pharaonis]